MSGPAVGPATAVLVGQFANIRGREGRKEEGDPGGEKKTSSRSQVKSRASQDLWLILYWSSTCFAVLNPPDPGLEGSQLVVDDD
ncbi:hypothetical protein AXG93_544s1030 [Marchantia polymorpha subsp. ruderalis]|uniref:Uncharacterized protein n=1 Tax=Marchantia polymorpha subsp. ruderalis TaxID=1480154 RepID=A0A176VGV4_MARPO|nr:hypothetical protein AXG93_544s1030 [Marchantia polymorpha subsp. ruderalis]